MIVVKNEWGQLVKVFHQLESGVYGIHNLFGLIDEKSCSSRIGHRKRKGLSLKGSYWKCLFNIEPLENNSFRLKASQNCKAVDLGAKQDKPSWKLETLKGSFYFSQDIPKKLLFEDCLVELEETEVLRRSTIMAILSFLLLFLALWMSIPEIKEEEKIDPIEVTVIEDQKTVPIIKKSTVAKAPKELTKEQKARRAVKQNLGFLGMLGTTKIKKVVGGAPTDLKDVSVGAGEGKAGSGGELIAGLGKGVRKTTVGNTGVSGLGGIGTKGAGGGQGGYGNVNVASGEGVGISQIAVGDEVLLEGGLSKYAVRAAIAKYLNQVRACYEMGLQRRPGLMGTVGVHFEVSGNGTVNYSRVGTSSLGDRSVETCITGKMLDWEFPKPKGGQVVKISYPFLLRPVKS